jgi:phage N-6-adenine-methyltransferase
VNNVHFSSASDEWATPQAFFDTIADKYGPFHLDPCATAENAKAVDFFTREQDGLAHPWHGTVWMNPPYGREIGKWVAKAVAEIQRGGGKPCCLFTPGADGYALVS